MKRILVSTLLLSSVLLAILAPVSASASDISDAIWTGVIQITNNSTAATGVSVNFTANTTSFISNGYINSTCTNTAIQDSGTDVAYMPGYAGNPWIAFVSNIGANSISNDTLYTGGVTDMNANIRYFPGTTGMAITDNASIRPTTNFTYTISGYLDTTTTGSFKHLFIKSANIQNYVDSTTTGNVTFYINRTVGGDDRVSCGGVPNGEATIICQADGTNFWMTIYTSSAVYVSGNASIGAGVDTTVGSNLYFVEDYAMPYVNYATMAIGGTLQGSWQWEYSTTFTDDSGNSHTATPSFRTTSSDPDVSAELISFGAISSAIPPPETIDDPPDFVTANISGGGAFTSNTTGASFPGIDVISAVATASDTPVNLLLLMLGGFIILALSFYISHLMRKYQSSSIFIKTLILLGGIGLLVALHVFDKWILYLFAMLGIAISLMAATRNFEGTGNANNNFLGFLAMTWFGMTILNRILEGQFATSAEVTVFNKLTVFQPWNIGTMFSMPVPNLGFITTGLPALIRWDYGFFGGDAQIFTYLLYSVTAVVSFIIFMIAVGAAANIFSRTRG